MFIITMHIYTQKLKKNIEKKTELKTKNYWYNVEKLNIKKICAYCEDASSRYSFCFAPMLSHSLYRISNAIRKRKQKHWRNNIRICLKSENLFGNDIPSHWMNCELEKTYL